MSRFKMIIFTILISVGCIVGFSFYKIQKQHEAKILIVSEKRIEEAAQECYYDNVCEEKVTLGELIHYGYSKEEVNPLTKMYYSKDSYVEKKGTKFQFVPMD